MQKWRVLNKIAEKCWKNKNKNNNKSVEIIEEFQLLQKNKSLTSNPEVPKKLL